MAENITNRMAKADDVAAVYQISKFSVLRAARAGLIPSVRIGRLLRFDMAKVHEALETSTNATSGDNNDHQAAEGEAQ